MDIGFFRGPRNLQEVYDRTADPQPKLIESRQGYVCYLLIVDRATRYIWVFPLRSKSINPDLIDLFLRTHGLHRCVQKTLRTDGEGSLAESVVFRNILLSHGYILQKTATDTSSQNGVAERPHRTLGEMTRCMLYSAAMPIYFWADAIVYSAYVYNRLYHDAIGKVPFNAWTGRRANVKHLRAFGARVLVKRSGHRPTKGDPHYYDGRFLRFTSTEKNIIYHDETTHRDKTGRHCVMDEFHYASPVRPPGAQQVFDSLHLSLDKQDPLEEVMEVIPDDNPVPTVPLHTLDPTPSDRSRHAGYTADAAVVTHNHTGSEDNDEPPPLVSVANTRQPPRHKRYSVGRPYGRPRSTVG